MHTGWNWRLAGATLAMFGVMSQVIATESFYASSERFGYVGTVSVYDTYANARSGRNPRFVVPVGSFPFPRDGAVYVVKNAPEYDADYNIILTNWWANGGNTPSNQNAGFFQLYDENYDTWQNQQAWWSRDFQTFTVTVKGRNATYGSPDPMDYARFWNAGAPAGSGESTRGTFLSYEYTLTATGLNGVKAPDGFVTNTSNASDYSGSFTGIFLNQSTSSPASNGYYVFEIRFNNLSWAKDNDPDILDDEFGSFLIKNR